MPNVRNFLAIICLLPALLLVGCSSDLAQNLLNSPGSSSSSSSPSVKSKNPESRQQEAAMLPPPMPESIDTYSEIAAREFFDYYFASTAYAFETLETDIIARHGSAACENCVQTFNTIETARTADFPVQNIAVLPTRILDIWLEEPNYYHVEFDGKAMIASSDAGSEFTLETAIEDVAGSAQIAFIDSRWTMLSYGPSHPLELPNNSLE